MYMRFYTFSILIILSSWFVSEKVWAQQIRFHLAYMTEQPDTKAVRFRNDEFFKAVSVHPFFKTTDILNAKTFISEGRAGVEIEISNAAQKKLNAVVAKNIKNQDQGLFNQHIGLGIMKDGKPLSVMQGLFQPIPDRKMWLFLIDDRLPLSEQLRQAEELAKKIK